MADAEGPREVRCEAVYTLVGLDLRLLEGGEMLRTELCRDAWLLEARAKQREDALRASGWQLVQAAIGRATGTF